MELTKKKQYDLTEGVIWKGLILFFIPILAGSLFQQLYTTADAVIVGRFAGKGALASIDAIYSLTKLPVNFLVGISSGATIIISQYFGAKNQNGLSKAVHTAIAFAFLGGMILSISGIVFSPCLLRVLKVPEDIFAGSLSYARIYFAGMAASMTYNIGTGILRAVGDTKSPFYFLLAANIVNVALDLLFIGAFKWNVAGAALSTVLSQLLSAILVVIALMRTNLSCRLILKNIYFHKDILKRIFKIGLPVGIQSSLYPIANMLIQSNINQYGTNSIAAWAVCGKLDFLIWMIIDSLGITISTFSAQNFGGGHNYRIKKGVWQCLCISAVLVAFFSSILYVWCEPLGFLFVDDADVIALSTQLMKFLSPLYIFYIGGEIFSGAIRGTGESFRPMMLTLAGTFACRTLWILAVVPTNPSLIMVLSSYPVSWFMTSLIFTVYYYIFRSRRLSVNSIGYEA